MDHMQLTYEMEGWLQTFAFAIPTYMVILNMLHEPNLRHLWCKGGIENLSTLQWIHAAENYTHSIENLPQYHNFYGILCKS